MLTIIVFILPAEKNEKLTILIYNDQTVYFLFKT